MQEGGAPGGATAPAGQSGQERQSPQRGQAEGGKDKQGQAQPGTQGQRGQKETTGQAPQGSQGKDADKGQQTQSPGQREPGRGTAETPRDQRQGQSPQRQDGQSQQGTQAQPKSGESGKAAMSTEQRTKIRETVLRGGNAPRASNVNFAISVGTTVPTTVRVVEVPAVIIEVHPEYRGHMYFVVDDEIIIVDRNHRIIAVLTV
jgi:hypothetical protein